MNTGNIPSIQNIASVPNSISRNIIADSLRPAQAKAHVPLKQAPHAPTLASLVFEDSSRLPRRQPWATSSGLHFTITHRFWLPNTVCKEGEEVFSISIETPRGVVSLPLSTQLRILCDYLARHQFVALTASQIAAGINSHPFFKRYGANARGKVFRRRTASRAGVKQQMMRLRRVLAEVLQEAGMDFSPRALIVSEVSDSNERGYRLKAIVKWLHIEY